jgi:hypothetical protein
MRPSHASQQVITILISTLPHSGVVVRLQTMVQQKTAGRGIGGH